jgi:hypothetical protein
MLPAVVVIDLSPVPSIEAAAVLVERCSQVVASSGTGGCELRHEPASEPNEPATEPAAPWLVRVTWSGDTLQSAQIALFRGDTPYDPVRQRELSFSVASPEQDRWESVGLLVAALVVSTRPPVPPPAEPAAVAPEPPPPLPKPEVSEPAPEVGGHLAIAGLLGSALSDAPLQFGASLLADIDSPTAPVRPMLRLSYGHASGDIELHDAGLALGLGFPWRGDALEVEPYALLLGQLLHVRASQAGASDSATELRWGGSAGLNAYPRLDSNWSIWIGTEATLATPRMVFELSNQPGGQLRPLGWRGFLGLRGTL